MWPRRCPICKRVKLTVRTRRRNTNYHKDWDTLNYIKSCMECFEYDCDVYRDTEERVNGSWT